MRLKCLVVACLLTLTIDLANATTFDWTLSGDFVTGSGTLTASDSGGQYLLESISGEVATTCTGTPCVPQYREIITVLTPHQTYASISDIGGDNLIFPAASSAVLDSQGLVFSIGGIGTDPCPFTAGCYMRIYANTGGTPQYDLFVSNAGVNAVDFVLTAEISSSVAEPSTWAMMVLGLAGVGFMACRGRRRSMPA